MKYRHNLVFFVFLGLGAGLFGCNNQLLKETEAKPDAFDLKRMAEQAYDDQDWLNSEKYYTQLVKNIPEDAENWFRLGNVYARTQRPDAAVISYREAVLRDPEMSKAWFNMGILQLKQAASSFDQLQRFVQSADPLYASGRRIFNGILDLIKDDSNKH